MASDESASGVVRWVEAALSKARVPYMVVGSLASSIYGAPRTTQDVDVVISLNREVLEHLLLQFPEESFYVSREAALQALVSEGMFNVIDLRSGWKVDFIVRKSRGFSTEEFERRRDVEMLGSTVQMASAEDVVISKLEWAEEAGSERQIRDVVGILRTQGEGLDHSYIERWVKELALGEVWQRALEDAELES